MPYTIKQNIFKIKSNTARKYILKLGKHYTFFKKQLHFLFQPHVAYGHMNFQPERCLAVAYSIHFQPLVVLKIFTFKKFILLSFALIGGKS